MAQHLFRRVLNNVVVGAGVVATLLVAVIGLVFGFGVLIAGSGSASEWDNDVHRLEQVMRTAIALGIFVGGLAGLVSAVSHTGVRIITSVCIIGGCAVVAMFSFAMGPRYKGSPEPTLIPLIVGAVCGALMVLYFTRSKRGHAGSQEEQGSKPPTDGAGPSDGK